MIVFVGDEDRGYFVRESAALLKQDLYFVGYSMKIDRQINEILQMDCDYLILDIEQYTDDPEELAGAIARMDKAKGEKCSTIIYAPGYSPSSRIIQELKERGLYYFLLSANMTDSKEQLERCMQGYYEEPEIPLEETQREEVPPGRKIGITGACHRIGATTLALQLVRYFQSLGYRACYIQVNATRYVEQLADYFNVFKDAYFGQVTFDGIDLYYKQENISEILKQGYDYYIYDFGTYTDTDFNKTMFLEKDIRIFVLGSKPSELPFTDEVLRNEYYKDVLCLFNFVSRQEQPDVLELMEERAGDTYFAGYTPDPFVFTTESKELFEHMIPTGQKELPEKKKWFFGKSRKRGGVAVGQV